MTTLPRATLRRIADIALVDWRSVRATLEGRHVARRAGERIRVALRALDIPIPPTENAEGAPLRKVAPAPLEHSDGSYILPRQTQPSE